MLPKRGLCLKQKSGGQVCLKGKCFDVFLEQNENKTWQKIYNYELHEIFNESNIVSYIKVKRLAWAGHLMCMSNDRTLKNNI
jgi:hypothetical protein